MYTSPPDVPAATHCAPYRQPPTVAITPSAPSRALSIAAGALSTLALLTTLASMHIAWSLLGVARANASSCRPTVTVTPIARLGVAIEAVSQRHHVPLFIAPGLDVSALRSPVADGALGSLRESVRALDGYAARRGLWFHEDDRVLRLDREVTVADLDCAGTVDACATRLERLASVTIQRSAASGVRSVHLRISREVPVVESARSALAAAGYQVDVIGRTLYVADGPADAAARHSDSGIRDAGRGVYVLSPGVLDAMLSDQMTLMRSTRILPESRGGRVVGVRVFGVRPDDLLARLGIVNGDVIRRVNGVDIASPDRCLEAYTRLRQSDRITVALERGGRSMTLVYVIA